MRIGYVDPFSGATSEMLLGALLDAGAPESAVLQCLDGLRIDDWKLRTETVSRRGVGATLVRVQSEADDVVRTWAHIQDLLQNAALPEPVRTRALATYRRLAEAEARIHRRDLDRVHFHELGPLDGLIAIVGACAGFHALSLEAVVCGPVAQGIGMARSEHGLIPIPAPVVLELLRGAPTYSTGLPVALTTAAGAALLAEWAQEWGPLPPMRVEAVGYGAGIRQFERPNVLRLVVGEPDDSASGHAARRGGHLRRAAEVDWQPLDSA